MDEGEWSEFMNAQNSWMCLFTEFQCLSLNFAPGCLGVNFYFFSGCPGSSDFIHSP